MIDLSALKICFLAGTLGQGGGAEQQLYYILKALQKSGARVRLLCLTQGEFWENPIQALGVPVTWVGQHPNRLMRLARIVQELREDPPDIIQSQHFYTNLYAGLAARWLGVPGIGAMRSDGKSEVQATGRVLGYFSLIVSHVIAPNSRVALDNAQRMGVRASKLMLLPNVVDTETFHPQCCESNKASSVRLMTAGRLVQQKRVDRFLSVVALVRHQCPRRFEVVISGDGPEREGLESKAAGLDLAPDTVTFLGSLPDLDRLYRQADVFVLTSDREGTPNVILEAMASGLPVVATNVGGVSDIVLDSVTGFLVEPDDEKEMALAISQLISDSELRKEMGRQGRSFVERNHAVELLPAYIERLYQAVLG